MKERGRNEGRKGRRIRNKMIQGKKRGKGREDKRE